MQPAAQYQHIAAQYQQYSAPQYQYAAPPVQYAEAPEGQVQYASAPTMQYAMQSAPSMVAAPGYSLPTAPSMISYPQMSMQAPPAPVPTEPVAPVEAPKETTKKAAKDNADAAKKMADDAAVNPLGGETSEGPGLDDGSGVEMGTKRRMPADTAFKQQRLKAYSPTLTPVFVTMLYAGGMPMLTWFGMANLAVKIGRASCRERV